MRSLSVGAALSFGMALALLGSGAVSGAGNTPSLATQLKAVQSQLRVLQGTVAHMQRVRGPAGPSGPRGVAGPPGLMGIPGLDGIKGATGPSGSRGPAGAQGAPGVPGAAGPAGEPGLIGPPGPVGPAGPPGEVGADGATGPVGLTGVAGPQGASGAGGPSGPSGPVGPTGPAGAAASTALGPGTTLTGDLAFAYTATLPDQSAGTLVSFSAPLPSAPIGVGVQGDPSCTGPGRQAPGVLCLYPASQSKVSAVATYGMSTPIPLGAPINLRASTADTKGFLFVVAADGLGLVYWQGTYSYTVAAVSS